MSNQLELSRELPLRDPERCFRVHGYARRILYRDVVLRRVPLAFYREDPPQWSPRAVSDEHVDPEEQDKLIDRWYREAAETELLTETEADQLIEWVGRTFGESVYELRKTATHSLPEGVVGCGAIPAGGGHEQYDLYKHEGYDLPFKTVILVERQGAEGWRPELACFDLRQLTTRKDPRGQMS